MAIPYDRGTPYDYGRMIHLALWRQVLAVGMRRQFRRLVFYPIVLAICWTPNTVSAVHEMTFWTFQGTWAGEGRAMVGQSPDGGGREKDRNRL
jgi:hypothetical protein